MKLFILVVATLISLAWTKQFSYEGYKVWSVTPSSTQQGELLLLWQDNDAIDFWESLSRTGQSSRIMVAPDTQDRFVSFLKKKMTLNIS